MAVISWDNYVDDATVTSTGASGTEVLSDQNLKTRQVGDIMRWSFTGASTLYLSFDLGSAKATNLVCLINHNLAGLAYTINFGTTAGASDVGQETGTFWNGGTSYDPTNDMLYFSSTYTARYVRIAVTITGAMIADVGRVWLDNAWSTNVSMDFSLGPMDRSTKTKSRGGSTYASRRQILRKLDIKAIGKSTTDFIGDASDSDLKSFLTMDLAVGTHGEIVCLPLTDSQLNKQRLGVYGTISSNSPIRVISKGSDGFLTEKRFTIEEDRG